VQTNFFKEETHFKRDRKGKAHKSYFNSTGAGKITPLMLSGKGIPEEQL